MNDPQPPQAGTGRPSESELLRLVLDSATDFAIFTQDCEGIVTTWNRGAERLLGWSEEEAVGADAAMIFTPQQRAAGVPVHERAGAMANGSAEDERWHVRRDGSRFWASGLMMPLADPATGFVKIFRDRTAQHLAEARLAESEERFRLLATNIPQLVFRSRGTGWRTWGSPQWEVFTGLSHEVSIEFGWLDAVHPEDREATVAAWDEARAKGEYYSEHRIRRQRDDEYRWHQTRARPITETAVDDWVGTSADIHDLRTLKDRQQVLLAELQHRTRNLLAVVQAIARQTERNSDDLAGFSTEFESRLRALSRVQGLLAELDYQNLDLRALVQSELEAHGDGEASKVHIEGPAVTVPANSAQALGLALHELATNAIKYGALRQPSAKLSVVWETGKDAHGEERIALEWVESGVAMPDPGGARRKGYGSELIERALPYQLTAQTSLVFGPDGVRCSIDVPATRSQSEPELG